MSLAMPLFLFLLSVSILGFSCGCATFPDVAKKIEAAPSAQEPLQIVSARGLLSPKQSRAIMDRLQRSVAPTDILERHTAVVESVTESPLTRGNNVTLLADGQATHEIKREEWKERPIFSKMREWFAHLFVQWL